MQMFSRLAAHRACAIFALSAAATIASPAETLTTLLSFDGANGAYPGYGSLVEGTDGNFYGTTLEGAGNGCSGGAGCGTVFKITPAGTLTTLHSFDSTDGAYPYGGLVQAANGNFYGTTQSGGASTACLAGCGTVFSMTPGGALTTLHSFAATDGATPLAALVQTTSGDLWGTTYAAGANGCGTVFKITPAGTLTTVYNFAGPDGCHPLAALVPASDGNLYGTTEAGGTGSCNCGTVFKITTGGTLTTLYTFGGTTDGGYPIGALAVATNGNLYGTTSGGGSDSFGTVFQITLGGTLTTLQSFNGAHGDHPNGSLVQATDGNLYGTTYAGGGTGGFGTIFRITLTGTLTMLQSLDNTDGSAPLAGLIQGTGGELYGTTYSGGTDSEGTIFSLSVGLGPFVETRPNYGKVGAPVEILGSDLTGTTSVSFGGVAAAFTIVSATEITTTVPAGAATGTVQVITPRGTLSSNVPFRVKP